MNDTQTSFAQTEVSIIHYHSDIESYFTKYFSSNIMINSNKSIQPAFRDDENVYHVISDKPKQECSNNST